MTDIQQAIDLFEDERIQEALNRFMITKTARCDRPVVTGLETAIEIGILRIVYVSGIISVCRLVSGGSQEKVVEDLCQRIDELALLQMPAHEA